ncbi:MAG: hypothetical protein HKN70_03735 [Gammaproteobacteria bacterium]|nr:hypothetical protein [Gammaproteobacteria bacterium]
MKKLIPLVVVTALLTLGSFAHPPHDGKRGDRLASMLDLTDDQRASVMAIMESHHERKRGLHDMDREQRREAMQLMKQDIRSDLSSVLTQEQLAKFDEIQAQRSARGQYRMGKRGKRGDHLASMLELTDEQRATVKSIMESHRDRKRELRSMDREQRHEAMQLIEQDIRSELANVLTPEQLAKFDELKAHRGKRSRHRQNYRDHNGQSRDDSRSDTL